MKRIISAFNSLIRVTRFLISSIEYAIIPFVFFLSPLIAVILVLQTTVDIAKLILVMGVVLYLVHLKIMGLSDLRKAELSVEILSFSSAVLVSFFMVSILHPDLQRTWEGAEDMLSQFFFGPTLLGIGSLLILVIPAVFVLILMRLYVDKMTSLKREIRIPLLFLIVVITVIGTLLLMPILFELLKRNMPDYPTSSGIFMNLFFGGLIYIYAKCLFTKNPWKGEGIRPPNEL
jgi:hypothetical protein